MNVMAPVEFIHRENVTPDEICKNIRANAGRPLPIVGFQKIAICASGPSLADHIEDIRDRQEQGWSVASMNGSHNFLLDHGITPDYYFMVDARPINMAFVERANDDTTYIIASQCRPEIFEALEGRKVMIWQINNYEGADGAIKEAMGGRPCPVFFGALNVGQSCLNPILALGYRVWHLFGFDGSMRGQDKHAFPQPQNDGERVEEFFWPLGKDNEPIEGVTKRYLATSTMAQHAATFHQKVSLFRNLGIEIGIIGEGLLPDMTRALAQKPVGIHGPDVPKAVVPAPRPRKRPAERLPIVCMKWEGHIPYYPADVNIWAAQVDRWLTMPHELVCITDDPQGIDGGIRTIPLWREHFEHGRDWHRLKLFADEMADLIGPRFVSMDLDTVVCGPLDPLFAHDAPFKCWKDPNRRQYCTALFQMDAGAFPHVLETFDAKLALHLRTLGIYGGYDQAWISHVLPGQPMWGAEDGVLSFKRDILKAETLEARAPDADRLPDHARVINFHGAYNPRDRQVQKACPWVGAHWR